MPTIDTSTIEGFEGMSAEQKVEALLKAEIPERWICPCMCPKTPQTSMRQRRRN